MSAVPAEPLDLSALSAWAPQLADAFVSLSSDIALVLDADGIVLNVAQGGTAPIAPSAHEWVGRDWADTVTGDTRAKIGLLLKDVASTGFARRREVNHPTTAGTDIPVAYTALRLGIGGPVLVVGRDLRAVAAIQQRFVDAQREMEQGYWRTRQSESRYRLLFQVAHDAVMVVDAETLHILEANEAAAQLFDMPVQQMHGRAMTFGFENRSRGAVEELLATSRRLGQPAEIRARLSGKVTPTLVAATPLRVDDSMRLLVRVRPLESQEPAAGRSATLARMVDAASESVVVTDSTGRILAANPALLTLLQLNAETELKGRLLQDWIVNIDQGFDAVIPTVRRQGIARQCLAQLRLSPGSATTVLISAALLAEGEQECIGFTIQRHTPADSIPGADPDRQLAAAVEHLAQHVGALALPDVLREVAALVERHAIQRMEAGAVDDAAIASALGITEASLSRRRRRLAMPLQQHNEPPGPP